MTKTNALRKMNPAGRAGDYRTEGETLVREGRQREGARPNQSEAGPTPRSSAGEDEERNNEES